MNISRKCLLIVLPLLLLYNAVMGQIEEKEVEEDLPYILDLYKYLHTHPELSFREENTAERIIQELEKAGFEVTKNVGGHGLVGILKNGKGPTVMVRTDLDALPVVEQTNLSYASEVKDQLNGKEVGVMHACGHDVHMSVFTGTARYLADNKNKWKGTLVFIGQPAEERAGGARAMLNDGLYSKFPLPDYALALHVSTLEAGKVGVCSGYALANVDMVDITVYGKGGHGAYPHTTIDPIVLSARIINALQTIVSREISPLEPAVVTVGSIHGGSKGNVIPEEVKMELTLRSYTQEVREATIEKIERILKGEAIAAGLTEEKFPKLEIRDERTPALYNDPELAAKMKKAMTQELGQKNVLDIDPVMGGEDFSEYGRTEDNIPILLFWLGSMSTEDVEKAQAAGESLPSLHSPFFAPDPEPTLSTGIRAMSSAVIELMKP